MRARIVATAEARFRHYGYGKTTVADIAGDLGVSSAYIYKFFDSKLAVCEAVCTDVLGRIGAELDAVVASNGSAAERLRRYYSTILRASLERFFNERKLHDMVRTAMENRWCAVSGYRARLRTNIETIVRDGRVAGEFETRTPLGDVVTAVNATLNVFANPGALEYCVDDDLAADARHTADLVLRALAK